MSIFFVEVIVWHDLVAVKCYYVEYSHRINMPFRVSLAVAWLHPSKTPTPVVHLASTTAVGFRKEVTLAILTNEGDGIEFLFASRQSANIHLLQNLVASN